jgi:hypothetical protein
LEAIGKQRDESDRRQRGVPEGLDVVIRSRLRRARGWPDRPERVRGAALFFLRRSPEMTQCCSAEVTPGQDRFLDLVFKWSPSSALWAVW